MAGADGFPRGAGEVVDEIRDMAAVVAGGGTMAVAEAVADGPHVALRLAYEDGTVLSDRFRCLAVNVDGMPDDIATTDPLFSARLLAYGPAGLDALYDAGHRSLVTHLVASASYLRDADPTATEMVAASLWLDDQGLIHVMRPQPVVAGTVGADFDGWPAATGERVEAALYNTVPYLEISVLEYVGTRLYQSVPQLEAAFAALGCGVQDGHEHLPLPAELLRRLDRRRSEDTESGVYYPPVAMTTHGMIDAAAYVSIWAGGALPAGSGDMAHYPHDIASDHMVTMMVFGAPLMTLLQQYAMAANDRLAAAVAAGRPWSEQRRILEHAAGIIDQCTALLSTVDLHAPLDRQGLADEITASLAVITDELLATGRADGLPAYRPDGREAMAQAAPAVTAEGVFDALAGDARRRFGIAPGLRVVT